MSETMTSLLQRGRNGNALLFCGAGLTADSLNFSDSGTIGVTTHLLSMMNDQLAKNGRQSGFRDIRNAAKRFRTDLGNHTLLSLLQSRFSLSNISASVEDILLYPWHKIYTTNYDNGIELAMQRIGKKFTPLNNLDSPSTTVSGTAIVHLHGYAPSWNAHNFENSCVLDADSYHKLSGVIGWLNQLRFDIERAEVVIFVGFSASDFHLTDVLFNSSGLRKKAFFINRMTSNVDPDEQAVQDEYGEALYIGREEFAKNLTEILGSSKKIEPRLSSFARVDVIRASESVPPVSDIEDLFIWGAVNQHHLKRDRELLRSDYHVLRREVETALDHLSGEGRIAFFNGDICDGKSLVIADVVNSISAAKPVFILRHTYADIVEEVSSIIYAYPNAVLVIENCFSIREDRLLGIARHIASSAGGLILSARSISTEAESNKFGELRAIPSLLEIGVGRLNAEEIDSFVALIDQIAGWRDFRALSPSERRRFVATECRGVIPSVLLRLLESEYVKNKYKEEYNRSNHLNERDRQTIIAALIIANIGFDAPVSFISDLFGRDLSNVLRRSSEHGSGIKLVRIEGNVARTVPSIGVRNILRSVVPEKEIVNTNIFILENMAKDARRTDFESHLFSQLMRYSILSSIVSDEREIARFFDHISKIAHFRDMPLFWLQWYMAVSARKKWTDAEKFIEMGFTAATAYEKRSGNQYNRKQLNDREAKFIVARADDLSKSGAELFRDLKKALEIVGRLMKSAELTHHPYETLLDISRLLRKSGTSINSVQLELLQRQFSGIVADAQRRIGMVPDGYQRSHASEFMGQIQSM